MNTEAIKESLKGLEYGDIRVVAMTERGSYSEETVPGRNAQPSYQEVSDLIVDLANETKSDDEDLSYINRSDEDTALSAEEINKIFEKMTAKKHIIIVECLFLGTSEIKNILNYLVNNNLEKDSKLLLLDLPQLEYMMLRDAYSGQLAL